jgi:V8-like Glu-specific endopeptidase
MSTKHRQASRERGGRPMTRDEIARVIDEGPTGAVPSEIAEALGSYRLHLSSRDTDFDPRDHLVREEGGGWTLRLPPHASLGRPGSSGERLDRTGAMAGIAKAPVTTPHRPAWAASSVQARDAAQVAERVRLRRVGGRAVEPFYGVYPPDDRQVYWPAAYPWRCIGRVFTWSTWGSPSWSWSGAGVLVGPRHVLTAGHVCPWGSESWGMLFVPGYWDGSSALGAGAQSWTEHYRGWNTGDQVAANDIAVMKLYDPIGSWLGWMGTKVYDGDWEGGNYWTLAGYPGLIAGASRPSRQSGIPVLDDDEDGSAMELEHHGDSSPGDSGGPFFGFWDDGPYAVGTVSGGETISGGFLGIGDEDNNISAGGEALVDLVLWAQQNWP